MIDDYLESRRRLFQAAGFSCLSDVPLGDGRFDLIAVKSRWAFVPVPMRFNEVFVFARFAELDPTGMEFFIEAATGWASRNTLDVPAWAVLLGGEHCCVYPIALVERPDELLLEHVREPRPLGLAGAYVVPAVYDGTRGDLHYFQKVPLLGNAIYSEFKKTIRKRLWPSVRPPATPQPPVQPVPREPGTPASDVQVQPRPQAPAPSRQPPPALLPKRIKTDVRARTERVEVPINAAKVERFLANARLQERFGFALLLGLAAALVLGFIWGFVNGMTGLPLEWVPFVGLGFVVGVTVRAAGKGVSLRFGIAGAALTLLGCLFCRALSTTIAVAWQTPSADPFYLLMHTNGAAWGRLIRDGTNWMNVLALVLTVFQGYYFAFRRVRAQEMSFLADGEPPQ
jgi:hypothetical protein